MQMHFAQGHGPCCSHGQFDLLVGAVTEIAATAERGDFSHERREHAIEALDIPDTPMTDAERVALGFAPQAAPSV